MANEQRPGLGRWPYADPRDADYPLMRAPAVRRLGLDEVPYEQLPTYRYHHVPSILNQDGYSRCVGYGWKTILLAGPVSRRTATTPDDIYWWAQDHDPWPGREPDYLGTTTRAGARACVHFGEGTEYRWARTVEEMVRWLQLGPLGIGIDWYEGMSEPDSRFFIRIAGEAEGGHFITVSGYNRTEGKFRLPNTWGYGWADRGRCWMSFDTMRELFEMGGEACSLTEMAVT